VVSARPRDRRTGAHAAAEPSGKPACRHAQQCRPCASCADGAEQPADPGGSSHAQRAAEQSADAGDPDTPQPAPLYDYSRPTGQAAAQQPADSIRFISEVVEGYTFTAKLERFFGVALPLAALNVLVLGWKPEWAVWSNLLFFFLIGAWLPVSHLVDKLDTDVELFRDLGIVLALNILCCNPLFAFVLYGLTLLFLWAVVRADINWSLLGVMAVYVGLRILFELVLMLVDYTDITDWLTVGIAFFGSLPLFAMFLGWFIGGMFRSDYA
jgi:hypothetical protein